MLEVLGSGPRPAFGFRGSLDITTSHIEAHAVGKNTIGADGNDEFDFVVQVFRIGRVRDTAAALHNRLSCLGKEHGFGAFHIATHFENMVGVIFSNTVNLSYWKTNVASANRQADAVGRWKGKLHDI